MINLLYCLYQHSHFQFDKPVILFSLVEQFAQIQNKLNIFPIEYLARVKVFSDIVYHCSETPFLKSIKIKKKLANSVKVIKKNRLSKCLLQFLKKCILLCDKVEWDFDCLCLMSWSFHLIAAVIIWKFLGCLCF